MTQKKEFYIGLMSGTSMDGVDAVLISINSQTRAQVVQHCATPYPETLRTALLSLQNTSDNELEKTALLSNYLAEIYAICIDELLHQVQKLPADISAIACHGQTIRHAPQKGYSYQIVNLALLAEITGINVIGDFRSRDIAAGGQGAPLVPAFHDYFFSQRNEARAILNIGGIANLTALIPEAPVFGFDTGPGNMLMDYWIQQHLHEPYDKNGDWAAKGVINDKLLQLMLAEPFFHTAPPKSTGRDLFNPAWLTQQINCYDSQMPLENIQATLLALTAESIIQAIKNYLPTIQTLYLCGGGTYNERLVHYIVRHLPTIAVNQTDQLGLPALYVEAAAFAWMGYCFVHRKTTNIPSVTGASGKRILGALYPA